MAPGSALRTLSHLFLRNRHARILIALLPVAVAAGPSVAQATTYRVGPGRTYTNIGAVAGLLNAGDVVEVDGNTTYPSVTFTRPGSAASPIVIRGIRVNGLRPVISGGANTVYFRTDTIGEGADHYVMEGFDITGGSSRCVFHQSDDLTLRDVVVHDCPLQGILGADWGSGSITIEHSEVYRCGSGTQNHQLYIGMDEDNHPDGVFRLQYSWIHDAIGGNNVKSRSARNEIYYNRIEGAYYHEIELIGAECCGEDVVREDSDVVGNLFVKKGANANFAVTRFGGDGTAQTWGRYRFVNNTVVVTGTAAVFRLFDGLESVEMHNNVFYRSGGGVTIVRTVEAVWASGERFAGSNNWISTGSTSVPTPWTGTITGSTPGFTNAAGGDYSPAAGSPLLNAGNETLSGPAGSPFPDPLFPPAFHPPGAPGAFGTPNPRPDDGQIDIGAWERGSGALPQLSVADVSVAEGSSGSTSAVFMITLSPAAATAVTVNVATANGTATAGSDYTAASSSVSFAAGDTSKTFSVAITPDTVDETDETFYLTLSGPTGASLSDGQGTCTIVDDDLPPVTLSINDVTVAEGNSGAANATFTVSLSAASASTVTVAYATTNGTATAGSDYVAQAGSLSIAAGQTSKTIAVAVNGDTTVEPNETFTLTLSGPSGAILADAQGQGTIVNDDATVPPPDLCAGLVTDKAAHPMTALARPAVGQAVTDPQFGTLLRRISAAPAGGVIKPMYSTISAWNADESRLILYRVGQGHLLYDGRTYQLIRSLDITPADLEQVYWHTSDPDILFYVDGNRFIRYHVSTAVKDTLTTFTFCSSASGGDDPMYISWDSKRIGLGCGSERFIYDMSTNTVVGRKTLTGGVPQIAPSGTLAYLDGNVVDTSLNTLRTLSLGNPWEHASLGQLASGHDTYNGVGYDGPEAELATFDLTDGTSRVIVGPANGYPYPPSGIHVSAMAYKRPGWVALSIVGNPSGQGLLDNEIVLADTNPGGKVCRVAHHRSWAGEGSVGYWAEPHAVPSPSGTRILFGSDWGNSGTVDAYVVELPAYSGAGRDGDLSLAASASPNPVAVGSPITHTLTVHNEGSTSVSGASLTDTLPATTSFVSASSGCAHAAGTVTCTLGTLAGGASSTLAIVVSANAVGTAVAQASVSSGSADPDTSNNSASPSVAVVPTASVNDVRVTEGRSGTTAAQFTVSLSAASAATVTVAYATANGTATAGSDYAAASGTLSFSPGSLQRTINVTVNGDGVAEPEEKFVVNLSSPANALIADSQGQGTIANDDSMPSPPGGVHLRP